MDDIKINHDPKHYFINIEEITFDPDRDIELFNLFGSSAKYVRKNNTKQQYELSLHLVASNPDYYTPFGFI